MIHLWTVDLKEDRMAPKETMDLKMDPQMDYLHLKIKLT